MILPVTGGPAARSRTTRSFTAAVAVVAALTLAAPAATSSYTVRRGDTLSAIAKRHSQSVRTLAAQNGIGNIHRIRIGQRLTIPAAAPGAAQSTHVVQPGDRLSVIAKRAGISTAALAAANGIRNPNLIRIGSRLVIPAPAGTAPAPVPAAASVVPPVLRANPDRLSLIPTFRHWSAQNGVPADLLMALCYMESGWRNDAVSPTGALGIGQLLPTTAEWVATALIGQPLDPRNPEHNIRMSARFLRWLVDQTGGDTYLSLAAYYQGWGSVRVMGVTPATRQYVDAVLALRDRHFSKM